MSGFQAGIARIGLAVELTDGRKVFLFSDKVAGHIEMETRVEYGETGWPMVERHITGRTTDIHITDLYGYTLVTDVEDTTRQLDSMKRQLEDRA